MASFVLCFDCFCIGWYRFLYYHNFIGSALHASQRSGVAQTDFVTSALAGITFRNVPVVSEIDFVTFLFVENMFCNVSQRFRFHGNRFRYV